MRLLLWLAFTSAVAARFCVHNEKGWCRGHQLWGWCFHNKTSGIFDCDDAGYCVGQTVKRVDLKQDIAEEIQEQLKNKVSSGCFARGNSSVCCCNDADGCNLGFIPMQPKYVHGQSCMNAVEEPNEEIKAYRPCDDPFCYAFLSSEVDGGLTTVVRGCHSRKLVMHHMYLEEDKKYNNNTRWKETETLASQPSCADILWGENEVNGTTSMCLDYAYQQMDEEGDDVDMKGRLCCCKGLGKCNEKFMWSDAALTTEELKAKLLRRDVGNSVGSLQANVVVALAAIFSVALLC